MQLKEFNVLLDIKKNYKKEEFEVVQGDSNSNVLNITLTDGLNHFDLSGTSVEIIFSKSDGTTVQQTDVTIINREQGRMRCVLKTNTIAFPGKVVAEVRVLEDETLLTSTRFEFHVRKSLLDNETIESTNEFPVLTQLISTTEGLIEQVGQIEKQVPEQVVTDLNQVSMLANQLQNNLGSLSATVNTHLAESASKHIYESGVNANGRYIKFDDGTVIMTRVVTININATGILNFDAPTTALYGDADRPYSNISTHSSTSTLDRYLTIKTAWTRWIGSWQVQLSQPLPMSYEMECILIMIGRWK